jgi:heme exporter protein D
MNWHSAAEFVQMGGYALYVWGSYGVTAILMAVEAWMVVRRHRRALVRTRESTAAKDGT